VLLKLSLVGNIQFVVEGILNFTFSDTLTSLVVCDTSSIVVRNNGYETKKEKRKENEKKREKGKEKTSN
jgi:hypothetical protein